jgi:hypothetical protein
VWRRLGGTQDSKTTQFKVQRFTAHQLMFDADGDWKQGSISIATINIDNTNNLKKSNFSFT